MAQIDLLGYSLNWRNNNMSYATHSQKHKIQGGTPVKCIPQLIYFTLKKRNFPVAYQLFSWIDFIKNHHYLSHGEKNRHENTNLEVLQQLSHQAIRLHKKEMTYKAISEVIGVHYSKACGCWKVYEKEGDIPFEDVVKGTGKGGNEVFHFKHHKIRYAA